MKQIVIGRRDQREKPTLKVCLTVLSLLLFSGTHFSASGQGELPRGKQTVLKLYVSAAEAYTKWKADPEGIHIIDVRTPEEYMFVGHPAMARNIPYMLLKTRWYSQAKGGSMAANPEFVDRIKALYKPDDTIFLLCRSGGRSAGATNQLAEAGFSKVFSVTDGFEGDKVNDPGSYFNGKRAKNGWKNSGASWTYKADPKLTYR